VSKKKADNKFGKSLWDKGNPPLVRFPLCQAYGLTFTPSVALLKSRGFRHLRMATADRGGSDKPFEKGLIQNFSNK
jgi:hypothetical protein